MVGAATSTKDPQIWQLCGERRAIVPELFRIPIIQLLSDAKIGMPITAFASSPKDTKDLITLAGGALVVVKLLQSTQGRGVVMAETRKAAAGEFRSNLHRRGSAEKVKPNREERDTARRAARVLGLNVAGVDILQSETGPKVLEVNSSPGLEGIEKTTGRDVADMIYEFLESKVRPLSKQR